MKLTRFFLKPTHENDMATIYAVSDNKKLINKFKKFRDINKFIIETLDLDEYEFKNYQKKQSKYFLKDTYLKTYNNYSTSSKSINIVTTYHEELEVFQKSDSFISSYIPDFPEEMYVFNDNYNEILNGLNYYDMISFYAVRNKWQYDHIIAFEDDDGFIDYEYDGDSFFNIDELNLFIKLFGDTLKIKDV